MGLGNLGQDLVSLGRGRLEEAVWAFLRVGQPDHATQCGLALVTLKAGTVQVRLLVGTNVFFNAYNIDIRGDACRIASFLLSIPTIFNPSFTSLSPAGQFEDAYSSYTSALN